MVNGEEPSACFLALNEDTVRFTRSVPCYIPDELNDRKGGTVTMLPLQQPTDSHAAYGGCMKLHRVQKSSTRYGTVPKGKVSCDPDGRINARKLNNDSLHAIAEARKLVHEVYGRSAQFQRPTVTNAVFNAVSQSLNWIADTGASMDFIGKQRLSRADKKRLVRTNDPKRCNTGNGSVTIRPDGQGEMG